MKDKRLGNPFQRQGVQNTIAAVVAILIGMLVGLVVLLFTDASRAGEGMLAILTGGFSDRKNMGQVLYYATPLIMTGLSVGFAKKTGLFNIGAPGQYLMGAFAAVYVGVKWTFLPAGIHCLVAILAACLFGAVWGILPGLLKAWRGINEVITCIMMNYIAMSMSNVLIRTFIYDRAKNQSFRPADTAELPKLGFDKIFVGESGTPSSVNAGILVAIVLAIVVWVILEKTRMGYELKACGFNKDAAKYAGISEKRNIVQAMVIAGALAGIGGGLNYLAGAGTGIMVSDTLAQQGFDGIAVALLGMSNPIAIIFTGILMAYLTVGGLAMQSFGFVSQVITIITSVIVYFAAFILFFSQIIAKFAKDRGQKHNANADSGEGGDPPGPQPPAHPEEGGEQA